jgi:hypothetical protein
MKLEPNAILETYGDAKTVRMPFEPDWREVAGLILPRQAGLWRSTEGSNGITSMSSLSASGERNARFRNFDITGVKALPKFTTVLDRICTPRECLWHGLRASDTSLMKQYRVKQYFEQLRIVLFQQRYAPRANFESMKSESYTSFGAYGTSIKFITDRKARPGYGNRGLLYRCVALRMATHEHSKRSARWVCSTR